MSGIDKWFWYTIYKPTEKLFFVYDMTREFIFAHSDEELIDQILTAHNAVINNIAKG